VRTFDLGGDKIPPFVSSSSVLSKRTNLRGLRFTLEKPEMLMTQLRGIIRAAQGNPVRILFPMLTSSGELEQGVEYVRLAAEKEGATRMPEIGAMIEVPSALFELDTILSRVDFASVGSNDLTQFMLAVAREETDAEGYYSLLYPGVLKVLGEIVAAADRTGCELSICGEAAGNPALAALLVGIGYRNLSMSPVRAAMVRHLIRSSHISELNALAESVLEQKNIHDIRTLLEEVSKPLFENSPYKAMFAD
jgi:signal transduction protein with GAF and PtsI domain